MATNNIPVKIDSEFMSQMAYNNMHAQLFLTENGYKLVFAAQTHLNTPPKTYDLTVEQAINLMGGYNQFANRESSIYSASQALNLFRYGNYSASSGALEDIFTYPDPRNLYSRLPVQTRNDNSSQKRAYNTLCKIVGNDWEMPPKEYFDSANPRSANMEQFGQYMGPDYPNVYSRTDMNRLNFNSLVYRPSWARPVMYHRSEGLLPHLLSRLLGGPVCRGRAYWQPYSNFVYSDPAYTSRAGRIPTGYYGAVRKNNEPQTRDMRAELGAATPMHKGPMPPPPQVEPEKKYTWPTDPVTDCLTSTAGRTAEGWMGILAAHGVIIEEDEKTHEKSIVILDAELKQPYRVKITDEQYNKIMPEDANDMKALKASLDEINKAIGAVRQEGKVQTFKEPLTIKMMESLKPISLKPTDELKQYLEEQAKLEAATRLLQGQSIDGQNKDPRYARSAVAISLDKVFWSGKDYNQADYRQVLATHGLLVVNDAKTGKDKLVVQSSSSQKDIIFELTDDQLHNILPKDGTDMSIALKRSLRTINSITMGIFDQPVSVEMLRSDMPIDISLNENVLQEILKDQSQQTDRIIDVVAGSSALPRDKDFTLIPADDYQQYIKILSALGIEHSVMEDGRIRVLTADLESIYPKEKYGVCNRSLLEVKGEYAFYHSGEDGRMVSIDSYNVGQDAEGRYNMYYRINGVDKQVAIDEKTYKKFLDSNEKGRIELFDKVVDEIELKKVNLKNANTLYFGERARNFEGKEGRITADDLYLLDSTKGFFKDQKNGRMVDVGDIWVTKNTGGGYEMHAVLDGEEKVVNISKNDYENYLRVNDMARFKMAADKMGSDLAIKDYAKEEIAANKDRVNIGPQQDEESEKRAPIISSVYAKASEVVGRYEVCAVVDGKTYSAEISLKEYQKFAAMDDTKKIEFAGKRIPEMQYKGLSFFDKARAVVAGLALGLTDPYGGPSYAPELYASTYANYAPAEFQQLMSDYEHQQNQSNDIGRGM